MDGINDDFPREIMLKVPRGKSWIIEGEVFSTDDLPDRLRARFVAVEDVKTGWKLTPLAKYSVEPIFSLRITSRQDRYGSEYYDVDSIDKLCKLISQPGIRITRSAVLRDEFVRANTGERPYWIYTPDDRHHVSFSENGVVWKANVIGNEYGYYYEYYRSIIDRRFEKVGDRSHLLKEARGVKPVVFFDTKTLAKVKMLRFA